MEGEWYDGWGHMAYDGVIMIILWGGLVVLALFLARYLFRGDGAGSSNAGAAQSPVNILEERFARGEIGEAEYEARRRVLTSPS